MNSLNYMNWKIILRWLALLPVLIGGFFVAVIIAWIFAGIQSWYVGDNPDSGYRKIFDFIIAPALGGSFSVYWTLKVAPSHRKIVAMIAAALILLLAVVIFFSGFYQEEISVIWYFLSSIAMSIGAGYVMYQYFEQGDDFNLFD